MKKITACLFVVAAITLGLGACKKDKDKNATLTGTWDGVSIQTRLSKEGSVVSDTTENLPSGSVLLTLKKDKTFELKESKRPEPETGYYTTAGNKLIMSYGGTEADTAIYSISGNNLQLNSWYDEEDKGIIYQAEQISRLVKVLEE